MGAALAAAAARVLGSGRYILGQEVLAFEDAFARYLQIPHAVGVGNGTDALEIALRACGVEAGHGVLSCANAGAYAALAARAIGAIPVYADVDGAGFLTEETLEQAIARASVPTRALVVTHLHGRIGDPAAVLKWARQQGLWIVEDCAQAHGARSPAGRAGTLGDAAAFSFYPTKNLGALGDAGMVVSKHSAVAARARALREYGWTARYHTQVVGGRNSRLDELQAAFLREMLPLLDQRNVRRRRIASLYDAGISHPDIRLPTPLDAGDVAHLYVVRSERRESLARHLDASGVGSAIHYPVPDHHQPAIPMCPSHVELPMTEAWCATVLSLPCFPELEDMEVARVIEACNEWPG